MHLVQTSSPILGKTITVRRLPFHIFFFFLEGNILPRRDRSQGNDGCGILVWFWGAVLIVLGTITRVVALWERHYWSRCRTKSTSCGEMKKTRPSEKSWCRIRFARLTLKNGWEFLRSHHRQSDWGKQSTVCSLRNILCRIKRIPHWSGREMTAELNISERNMWCIPRAQTQALEV